MHAQSVPHADSVAASRCTDSSSLSSHTRALSQRTARSPSVGAHTTSTKTICASVARRTPPPPSVPSAVVVAVAVAVAAVSAPPPSVSAP
eukprot:1445517-Pleurochrysis_carterae.AAC.1